MDDTPETGPESPAAPDGAAPAAPAAPGGAGGAFWRRWKGFAICAVLCLVADLLSKTLMFDYLGVTPGEMVAAPPEEMWDKTLGAPVVVVENVFQWRAVANTGMSFGRGGRRPRLILALAVLMIPAPILLAQSCREPGAPLWTLGAVFGGALGNLHDRLAYGYVRDFCEFFIPRAEGDPYRGVFNVADIGIYFGMGIFMAWSAYRAFRNAPKRATGNH